MEKVGYKNIIQILAKTIFALFIQFLPVSAWAYDFQDCEGCHDTSLESDARNSYIHAPFLEKQCDECHAAAATNDYSLENTKINWLSESTTGDDSHAFRFPDSELGNTLVVGLNEKSGQWVTHEFAVPHLNDLAEWDDSGTPPSLSDVKVISLNQGIFLTATVGWETNSFTDAVVQYGQNDLLQKSAPINRFGRKHQVVLQNLAANKTYHLIAISSDLFGRRQQSEPITFSTSTLPSTAQRDNIDELSNKEHSGEINPLFHRIGDDFLIEVSLPQASPIFLGTKGEIEPCLPEDEFHAGLSCIEVSSMDACLNCHNRHDHPLNVAPKKKGIIIPKEYPTFPGGRIICTSCHNPHSSKYTNLTRRDSIKGLCTSCHRK